MLPILITIDANGGAAINLGTASAPLTTAPPQWWFDTVAYSLPKVVAGDVMLTDQESRAPLALLRFQDFSDRGCLSVYGESGAAEGRPGLGRIPSGPYAANLEICTLHHADWKAGHFDYTPRAGQPGFIQATPYSRTGLLGQVTYRLLGKQSKSASPVLAAECYPVLAHEQSVPAHAVAGV
jgi:hypothetical protein